MAREVQEIGLCTCPVCGSAKAKLRLSASLLAYVTCNVCNVQIFARSENSDSRLRALAIKAAPAPEAAPAPAPEVKPDPAPAPAPKPAEKRPSWGLAW